MTSGCVSTLKIQPAAQLDQKHHELADKLLKLQGAEFDREHINAMVQATSLLRRIPPTRSPSREGATTTHGQGDDAVTQWVAKVIPKVQMHLDRAKEIQQKLAK